MIYKDGKSGYTMMKRFPVSSITRNKDYCLTKSETASKVLYFTANPNGEAEIVTIHLRKQAKLKTLKFDINFADLTMGIFLIFVSRHGPPSKTSIKPLASKFCLANKEYAGKALGWGFPITLCSF